MGHTGTPSTRPSSSPVAGVACLMLRNDLTRFSVPGTPPSSAELRLLYTTFLHRLNS